MSAILPTLEVITEFATGSAIASLDLLAFTTVERLDNLDTASARVLYPFRAPVTQRTPLRATGADGVVREYRVTRLVREVGSKYVDLDLAAPIFDLGTSGPIRKTTSGETTFAISATLTLSQWLTTYVLTDLSASGLAWLDTTLGPVTSTASWQVTGSRFTRLALLQALKAVSGQEFYLYQPSAGSLYRIGFVAQRGQEGNGKAFAFLKNLVSQSEDKSDADIVSVVLPFGDVPSGGTEAATISDNLWYAASPVVSGVFTAQSLSGGAGPIGFDNFLVGRYVEGPLNGSNAPTRALITASSASAQTVTTDGGVTLAAGDYFRFVADAGGTRLTELARPSALTAFSRVAQPLELSGNRGEANRLLNGRFSAAGLSGWSAVNPVTPPAFVEVGRGEVDGNTTTGAHNGARAASTSTATNLAVKNLPAFAWVRQQDELRVGGQVYTLTGNVLASATGTLALPITPSLAGTYASGTTITVIRRDRRTVTQTGDVSVLAQRLNFSDTGTSDFVPVVQVSASATAATGGYTVPNKTDNIARYDNNGTARVGPMYLWRNTFGTGLMVPLFFDWATASADVFLITASNVTASFGTATMTYSASAGTIQIGLRIRYNSSSGYSVGRVTSFTSTTITLAVEPDSFLYSSSGGFLTDTATYGGVRASMVMIPSGTSWTVDIVRQTRTFTLSGSHTTGATTLNTVADSTISTRNWVNTDTVQFRMPVTVTIVVTAMLFEGTETESGNNYYRLTYNESTSTNLELLATSDMSSGIYGGVDFGGVQASLYDIDKVNNYAYVVTLGSNPTGGVGTTGTLYTELVDTYTVNAAASWGTNGQVTLSLSSGISTTRYAIPKGTRVWSNTKVSPLTPQQYTVAAITNGATSLTLYGDDINQTASGSNGVIYRVLAPASTVPFSGNVLYAASSVQANASGVASVPITAANTNAISDNEALTITRPSLLRSTDPTTGSIVRLLYAPSNNSIPLTTTPGVQSSAVYVDVPTSGSRVVTALVSIVMNAGTYTLGQMPCIGIHSASGAVLAYARVADTTVTVNSLAYVRLICSTTLTTSQPVYLRVFGGFTAQPANWHVMLDAMLIQSAATDVLYTDGSWANALWQSAVNYLKVYGTEVKAIDVAAPDIQWITGAVNASLPPIGATVTLEDTGAISRLVSVTRDHFDYTRTRFGFDSLRETAARLLGLKG